MTVTQQEKRGVPPITTGEEEEGKRRRRRKSSRSGRVQGQRGRAGSVGGVSKPRLTRPLLETESLDGGERGEERGKCKCVLQGGDLGR